MTINKKDLDKLSYLIEFLIYQHKQIGYNEGQKTFTPFLQNLQDEVGKLYDKLEVAKK